jgi:UrcA family protein
MNTRSAMLAAATAAIALVASSGPAVAGEASNAQVEVSYRDLDLSTPAGAKALEQRLHRAAKEVCGMTSTTTGTRLPSSEARACYKETLGQLQERFAHLMPTDKERG